MKEYQFPLWIKILLTVYAVCGGCYLMFAFINASFNIMTWKEESRVFCAFMAVLLSIPSCMSFIENEN